MSDHIGKVTKKHERGLVMVLTGDGKGKTTSALGQALRAVGHGLRVYMIQFMKGRKYGEVIAAENYLPTLSVEQFGLDSFVMRENPAPVDIELARKGLERAKEIIASNICNMVILDEINVAIDFNLLSLDEVLRLIRNKPFALNLVLTGRYAPPEIIEMADMVSEVKEIKHHYASGIKDRAGIEF
ncbi:MAG: cob(I)yrinic acid a,c-diamide adenosyltransferase [Thermodesulfobacteriota bacterium]|nr:cob(I)yrinic acid a,c-diamide adenosyltransferase [Thermodesulfobacteriota bacterium]